MVYGLFLALALLASGCAPKVEIVQPSNSSFIIDPASISPEETYSAATSNVTGLSTKIVATASYQRFDDTTGGGTPQALTSKSSLPIRHAEVQILNSSGVVIQTGKTDGSGRIQDTQETLTGGAAGILIPRPGSTANYTVRVNSRSFNSYARASVLDDPQRNRYYSISASFSVTSSDTSVNVTLPTATASYNGSTQLLTGAAFSILDQVHTANAYMRSNSGNSSFVADKAVIFWKPGFDPGTGYLGTSSPVSFFLASPYLGLARGVYIIGGQNGSVCTDTDHFDQSIVLHEYGHFLENTYAGSDSPGGSHFGTSLIDPRLAWSEGVANFLQGAFLNRPFYWDTSSNSDCGSAVAMIRFSIRAQTAGAEPFSPTVQVTDVPAAGVTGEGIFREFSISRALFKTITDSTLNPDGEWANVSFSRFWTAFTGMMGTTGIRNMGMLLSPLRADINTNDNPKLARFDSVVSFERQAANSNWYATPLVTAAVSGCTPGSVPIQFPASGGLDSPTSSSLSTSLRRSNRYFLYTYNGVSANATVRLRYRKNPADVTANPPYNLNLIVYNRSHDFNGVAPYGQVVASANTYPETSDPTYPGSETISLSSSGTYLIRVQVTGTLTSRAETQFYFERPNAGDWLCPNP